MKKFVAILLVLVLTLSLCGCDMLDYKKAMDFYEKGEYATAELLFLELGDYKDAAQMAQASKYGLAVDHMSFGRYATAAELFGELGDYKDSQDLLKECNYKHAQECLDNGEYEQAHQLFTELGDHKDAQKRAVEAARCMLIEYVEKEGKFVKEDDGIGAVVTVEDGKLYVAYVVKFSGLINMEITVGGAIPEDSNEVLVVGLEETSSYAAFYDAEASLLWDVSTYKSGDTLAWDDFEVSGVTAHGTAYTQDTTMLNMTVTNAVKEMTIWLATVLEDSGLGLTMADIGFDNY